MFITKFKLANLITYMGIIFSIISIYIAYSKDLDINLAFIFFMMSGVCDLLDGCFARKFNRTPKEKEIGIQLDSLADVISFLIVPVTIYMAIGLNNWYYIVVYIFYVVMGITRLSYFNVFANDNKKEIIKVYRGLAVTYASLIFPTVYVILRFGMYFFPHIVKEGVFKIVYILVMIVVAIMFMLDIKIQKPGKKGYIFYVLLAITMIILFFVLMFLIR